MSVCRICDEYNCDTVHIMDAYKDCDHEDELKILRSRLQVAVEGLEFYAKESNHIIECMDDSCKGEDNCSAQSKVQEDWGTVAMNALEKIKSAGEKTNG